MLTTQNFLVRTAANRRQVVFFTLASVVAGLIPTTAMAIQDAPRKVIVCSTTQVSDFTRNVVGDRCEVLSVLAAGQDPHTYDPGNDDNVAVGRADLCLANGWNLEGNSWMNTLAESAGKPIKSCIEGVTPRSLEFHGEPVKDPHAWFNPRNAWIYVKNIRDAVSEIDPEHADEYAMRADLYRLQLLSLEKWIGTTVNRIPRNRRVLVTHHDAFGYFADAFNFTAMSPVGWTTGELTGVSIADKQRIVDQIRETGVPAIFVESSTNRELLEAIAQDSGVVLGAELYSDAMGGPGTAGETYIGMMRENVLRIVGALDESSDATLPPAETSSE